MNIQKINRRHRTGADLYYRSMKDLSSRLLKYKNGILYLEITIGPKWNKDYNATVTEIASLWRKEYVELSGALACKVYIKELQEEDMMFDNHPAIKYVAKKGYLFAKNQLN